MVERVRGFISCNYNEGMFSNERFVTFNALGGPPADFFAPAYDSETMEGSFTSDMRYLSTSERGVIGKSLLHGEGLLKVLKMSEQDGRSIVGVRCSWTGQEYYFEVPSENFTPEA